MRHLLIVFFSLTCLTSCNNERIEELEEENQRLRNEHDEANAKIEDYESKLDQIKSEASDGYDAISDFNRSQPLQDALDAFEDIQNEGNY